MTVEDSSRGRASRIISRGGRKGEGRGTLNRHVALNRQWRKVIRMSGYCGFHQGPCVGLRPADKWRPQGLSDLHVIEAGRVSVCWVREVCGQKGWVHNEFDWTFSMWVRWWRDCGVPLDLQNSMEVWFLSAIPCAPVTGKIWLNKLNHPNKWQIDYLTQQNLKRRVNLVQTVKKTWFKINQNIVILKRIKNRGKENDGIMKMKYDTMRGWKSGRFSSFTSN